MSPYGEFLCWGFFFLFSQIIVLINSVLICTFKLLKLIIIHLKDYYSKSPISASSSLVLLSQLPRIGPHQKKAAHHAANPRATFMITQESPHIGIRNHFSKANDASRYVNHTPMNRQNFFFLFIVSFCPQRSASLARKTR